MQPPGLYIHIPFCRSKCPYCGFYSLSSLDLLPDYLKALPREMAMYRTDFPSFDTIYVGGGTPSLLTVSELGAILEAASRTFTIADGAEITVEANPADIALSWLKAVRRLGVNRITIGVQSFDDAVLRFLGRRHNRSEALAALALAREAGFDNLGIDLIYGTPGQDAAAWRETLALAIACEPAHISCYQLTIEAGTPLGCRLSRGEIALSDEDQLADLFFMTSALLTQAGYIHYEVSNFARKETFRSRHNQKYWDHTPYLGLGPAAHSFRDGRRWWNHRDVETYLSDLKSGVLPREAAETLTVEQLRLETLFLGLRTRQGINLLHYFENYGCDLLAEKIEQVSPLAAQGLIEIQDGCLRPTTAGLAVADSLALI